MIAAAVERWAGAPDAATFPLGEVHDEILRVGKHFLDADLLVALDQARKAVGAGQESPRTEVVASFLDVALDKADGRYDYLTYTAQPLFPIVESSEPAMRRDRTVALLLADLLRFELSALDGEHDMLPQMRPTADIVDKRCHLAVRAMAPAARRAGVVDELPQATDDRTAATALATAVLEASTAHERELLDLTMAPVYTIHDEYQFLRVLQAFEATFTSQVARLRETIAALRARDVFAAARLLRSNSTELSEAAVIFSLLATMQVEAFRTFRAYTEGASAIQSESYKLMEALCRRPDADRLANLPYTSVPKVRHAVHAGMPTVQEAVDALRPSLPDEEAAELADAMTTFEAALKRWRRTHHSIAVRMLGNASGSGYSEGTPYLASVVDLPVFAPGDSARKAEGRDEPET